MKTNLHKPKHVQNRKLKTKQIFTCQKTQFNQETHKWESKFAISYFSLKANSLN